jgi:hypothetical protein
MILNDIFASDPHI